MEKEKPSYGIVKGVSPLLPLGLFRRFQIDASQLSRLHAGRKLRPVLPDHSEYINMEAFALAGWEEGKGIGGL